MSETLKLKPGHIQGETGVWEMVIGPCIPQGEDCGGALCTQP